MTITDFLVQIKDGLMLIQSALVNGVIGLFAFFKINIPVWLVQLVMIGFLFYAFLKWSAKLPKLILILLALFFVALVLGLVSNA